MEEKIYKKAENKTSLGERVIDSKNFIRQFSRKEVEDLSHMNDWVQCDECEKWRMIPPMANVDASKLPEKASKNFAEPVVIAATIPNRLAPPFLI